jgi:hypothetical protein
MSGDDEQACVFVSTRGILKSCDVYPRNPHKYTRSFPHAEYPPDWIATLKPGDSVYVCTWAMRDFVTNVFPNLPASCPPFVLVTGDADDVTPTDIFSTPQAAIEFLSSPRILTWFAQNCIARHPKLVPLPIGLDYHTIAAGNIPSWGKIQTPAQQEADLMELRATPVTIAPPHRAYSNFHFAMYTRFGRERQAVMVQVPRDCVYYEPQPTSRLECWQRQRLHHRFVLSPPGNGLDCHRTWEALCLGCIPIMRTSPLDHLWEGLPVWIVKSWTDVSEDSMARKAAEMDADRTNAADQIPAKLLLKTWVDQIRRARVKVTA